MWRPGASSRRLASSPGTLANTDYKGAVTEVRCRACPCRMGVRPPVGQGICATRQLAGPPTEFVTERRCNDDHLCRPGVPWLPAVIWSHGSCVAAARSRCSVSRRRTGEHLRTESGPASRDWTESGAPCQTVGVWIRDPPRRKLARRHGPNAFRETTPEHVPQLARRLAYASMLMRPVLPLVSARLTE